jgi:hypothetical protein
MFLYFCPPFGARLQQGGEGGVSITTQRRERSVMFTPLPPGTDTARPAVFWSAVQSR